MDSNNLKQVLDKYGKYVVQQAKSNLTKDKDCLLYTSDAADE